MWPIVDRSLPWLLLLSALATGSAGAQHAGQDATASQQVRSALVQAEHGDRVGAMERAAAILQEHPNFVLAMKLDAMLLEDAGDAEAASKEYAAALQIAPGDPDLLFKVGVADLLRGDTPTAAARLAKYTALQPHDEEGFYYLAQAYHHTGKDEEALKAIRRASELAPTSAPIVQKFGELLCSTGDNDKALAMLAKAQQADPSLPRINFDLAVASYNNMDLDQAVRYATVETQLAPSDAEATALLASAQIKLGQWDQAVPNLQHAIAAQSRNATLMLQLGHCQLELHQNDAAVATLHQALQLDPTQPLAHFFLSRAYAALGNAEESRHEAALHQRMLQEISFSVPKAQQQQQADLREQATRLLAAHHQDEALQLYAGADKEPGASPATPYVAVGATYLSMGDEAKAKQVLDHAVQLDSRSKGAHTYLGILALQQNDLAVAEQQFNEELQLDANHPLALAELGEVRYRQGRWDEAISLLLRSKTSIPRFLYMLTDSYFQVGNTAAADITAESLAAYARQRPDVMASLMELLRSHGETTVIQRIEHP
jgi:Tfp pilus assembly protein PilF